MVSLIVIASVTFSTQAQIRRNDNDVAKKKYGQHHGKEERKEMAEKLDLSKDQEKQMKSINMDFKNRMKELKNSNLSESDLRVKKEALQQERKQKMMTILTSEQKKKFSEFKKEEHKENRMERGQSMEKMKENLSLSDDQVKKLNEQRDVFKSKEERIENNQALSADQKQAQLKALREEKRNDLKNILTPDQEKKMEQMKHNRVAKVG